MDALKKDIRLVLALCFLFLLVLIGVFADRIACDQCLIPFEPNQVLPETEIFSPPGTKDFSDDEKKVHYWGTNSIGQDVASRLIHGIVTALQVGFYSAILTLIISLGLGFLAGYYANNGHRSNIVQCMVCFSLIILGHYYLREWSYTLENNIIRFKTVRYFTLLPILILFVGFMGYLTRGITFGSFRMPWDNIVLKLMEIFKSIPRLFLFLAIFAIVSSPSVIGVIVIIGLMRWPTLTRIIRAEIQAERQGEYIKNAEVLGFSDFRIMFRHILPNIYQPILIMTALNAGSAILIESSLSFLNIGLPADAVSFGRMLAEARRDFGAWWLAVGPGLMIFSLILAFNVIGDRLSFHFEESKR